MIRDGCEIRDVVEGGAAVWTGGKRMGVWMEHGGGARLGVDGCGRGCGWKTVDWKTEGSETGCGRAWTGVWMEDEGEPLQMEMIVGERGVDVGGQRPCTKHVSGSCFVVG